MIKVRSATTADLGKINHIRATLNQFPLFESSLEPSHNNANFVSVVNDEIIAYLALRSYTSFQSDEEGTVDIFVLRDKQRHGVGRALIDHVCQFAGCHTAIMRLTAGVSDDNPDAIGVKHFLLKVGFGSKSRHGKTECFEKDIKR